ncbi:MAG: isoprenylcysteine carboxylmethyltransferase family protein, partial [Gammaproteobacteria bacterium]
IRTTTMKILYLIYGFISYAVGLGGLTFFILFVGGWDFLPVHVDSGTPGPIGPALATNVGLILLFGLQHTVMARPAFKKLWATIVPSALERSTYVLISGVLMLLISFYWQPMEGAIWVIDNSLLSGILVALYIAGWLIAVVATFLINHFELFGLQQVWFGFRDQPVPAHRFTERFLYKLVRHPLQMGIVIGLWATPYMSMSHFTLAVLMTVYIIVGLHYEEIDLEQFLGEAYRDYKQRVPKLIPFSKKLGL